MRRPLLPTRRALASTRGALAAVAALATLAAVLTTGSAATAATAPPAKTFTAPIESWPIPWTSEKGCDTTVKPGPGKLSNLIAATWGTFGGFGMNRTCDATAESGHDDYRAVDWMATSKDATQKAAAESFISWLIAPDAHGNTAAMARRLGVMYVIWNNRMWRPYPHNGNPAGSWETYLSCASSAWATSTYDTTCHRNHVHVSLTPDGAWARTSYWAGTTTLSSPVSGPQNVCSTATGGTLCRHWGGDRIDTAIAASQDRFAAGSAGAVVLARADDYADALAGTPLAAAKGGPLLLTATGALDPRVTAEIERVLPAGGTVYLLGSTTALSPAVQSAVPSAYSVDRVYGQSRYGTALAVAARVGTVGRIALATGLAFPDALTAGNAMAHGSGPGASSHGVVLLTQGTTLGADVAAFLAAHRSAPVYAIGAPAAQAAAAAHVATAAVLSGGDRYGTASKVAETFYGSASPSSAGLVSGAGFADALPGGLHAALSGGPLLLTPPTGVPAATTGFLGAHAASLSRLDVYGAASVVGDAVAHDALAAMA